MTANARKRRTASSRKLVARRPRAKPTHDTPPRAGGSSRSPKAIAKRANIARVVQGLRRVVKALHTYSSEVYASYGLTGPQLWALRTLANSGPTTVGRLAETLAVHQSSASLLVDRLERRKLVRRMRGGADRRQVDLELTVRGRALVTLAPEAAQGRLLHGLERMTPSEVAEISGAVERLVEAMEVEDIKARFFFSDE